MPTDDTIRELRARHVVFVCSCGGRRWTGDENSYDPDRQERTPGDGLIPCGSCNHGGWDTPENKPAEPSCAFDEQAWPCDASAFLDTLSASRAAGLDEAWAACEAAVLADGGWFHVSGYGEPQWRGLYTIEGRRWNHGALSALAGGEGLISEPVRIFRRPLLEGLREFAAEYARLRTPVES